MDRQRFDELYKLCSESFNEDSYYEKLYYIRQNINGIIEDMEKDLLYNVDKDKWGVYICYVIRCFMTCFYDKCFKDVDSYSEYLDKRKSHKEDVLFFDSTELFYDYLRSDIIESFYIDFDKDNYPKFEWEHLVGIVDEYEYLEKLHPIEEDGWTEEEMLEFSKQQDEMEKDMKEHPENYPEDDRSYIPDDEEIFDPKERFYRYNPSDEKEKADFPIRQNKPGNRVKYLKELINLREGKHKDAKLNTLRNIVSEKSLDGALKIIISEVKNRNLNSVPSYAAFIEAFGDIHNIPKSTYYEKIKIMGKQAGIAQ